MKNLTRLSVLAVAGLILGAAATGETRFAGRFDGSPNRLSPFRERIHEVQRVRTEKLNEVKGRIRQLRQRESVKPAEVTLPENKKCLSCKTNQRPLRTNLGTSPKPMNRERELKNQLSAVIDTSKLSPALKAKVLANKDKIVAGLAKRLREEDRGLERVPSVDRRPYWQCLADCAQTVFMDCDFKYQNDPFGVFAFLPCVVGRVVPFCFNGECAHLRP